MTDDHEAIEQLERDGAHDEQSDGRDAGGVVAQERLPALRGPSILRPMYLATVD
jgi:hypothetical protein